MSTVRQRAKQERTKRILNAAREMICETERADFTMRAVADRAQVDLVTIYNLVGSKTAILSSLLQEDIDRFTLALTEIVSDEVTILFDAVSLLRRHYSANEPYFRSVVLAVYVSGESNHPSQYRGPRWTLWSDLVRRLAAGRRFQDDVSQPVFAGHLASIMFAHVLEWAAGDISLDELELRTHYGFALALQSVAHIDAQADLKNRFRDTQTRLEAGQSMRRSYRAVEE